jgi:hypothetical protein
MGDRVQVNIKDDADNVWFYSHWNGDGVIEVVKAALTRHARWDDTQYLARIIFEEMIKDSIGDETGYGIGTRGYTERRVIVDAGNQEVTIIRDEKTVWSGSFDEFVDSNVTSFVSESVCKTEAKE